MSEQVIENEKLKKASLIATIGSGMVLALQVLSTIMFLIMSKEMARHAYEISKTTPGFNQTFEAYEPVFMITSLIMLAFFIALPILMLVFSLGFKKAKGRGKAITVTVITSILLLISLVSLLSPSLGSVVNIIGLGMVLAGSIMAITAPVSEYEYNRLD